MTIELTKGAIIMLSPETFSNEAAELPQVPLKAATSYQNQLSEMTAFVNGHLRETSGVLDLIGGNPLQMMYDNHRHHGAFMATVFALGNYQLLAATLPWVYRAYHEHGFAYDYFPLELKHWISAVEKFMPADEHRAIIIQVYRWMIDQHDTIITLSRQELPQIDPAAALDSTWLEHKNTFRVAALGGNHRRCLAMVDDLVKKPEDISDFYLKVLQPVLNEVGLLWENNRISVAQEHLVSAIVGRVMTTASLSLSEPSQLHGKAVVASCVNEYHEIGAMMVSDILELDGWDVCYLGANLPTDALLDLLREFMPQVLALSVTMPFNIGNASEAITQIRQDPQLANIKVVVGGRAFSAASDLWRQVGADACAGDLEQARQLLRSFRGVT